MALAQTDEIIKRLRAAHPQLSPEAITFTPAGDRDQIAKLDRHGGKGGAFVAEIRQAMREGRLQAAMHSLKDAPGDEESPGLVFGAYLEREAVADALVLRADHTLEAFQKRAGAGYKIGTNAVRRAALLKRLYPQCEIIHFRGAADTRLRKLDAQTPQRLPGGGEEAPADALIMAESGLVRIGSQDRISHRFTVDEMPPAVGQGVIVVECRQDDWQTRQLLAAINDQKTKCCALAERELLWVLNGHCNSPIAGHATIRDNELTLRAAVLSLDGAEMLEVSMNGDPARPRELGRAAGMALLVRGAGALINASRQLP